MSKLSKFLPYAYFYQTPFKNNFCRWDMLTGDLELVDSVDGHYDVVYGTYEPTQLNWYFC